MEWKRTRYKGYSVSDTGLVRRDSTRRILKSVVVKGYHRVGLSVDGKVSRVYVHRLVAAAFLSNDLELSEVNHKDRNTSNNCAYNLEWCERTWNNQHAHGFSLEIDGVFYPSYRAAQEATGIAVSTIRRRIEKGLYTKVKNS